MLLLYFLQVLENLLCLQIKLTESSLSTENEKDVILTSSQDQTIRLWEVGQLCYFISFPLESTTGRVFQIVVFFYILHWSVQLSEIGILDEVRFLMRLLHFGVRNVAQSVYSTVHALHTILPKFLLRKIYGVSFDSRIFIIMQETLVLLLCTMPVLYWYSSY